MAIFRKPSSERLSFLPTTSELENLKFEAKSASLQSSCFEVFLFKRCLGFYMVFEQQIYSCLHAGTILAWQDFRGHRFALWELALGTTQRSSAKVLINGFIDGLNWRGNESCVRGPEKPDSNVRTRIMAAQSPLSRWGASCLPRVTFHWICKTKGERRYAIFHPLILKMGNRGSWRLEACWGHTTHENEATPSYPQPLKLFTLSQACLYLKAFLKITQ